MIEIRSYRRVFDLERRIYRVDRLRLNPGGVPVRGIVYFLAILGLVALVAQLPLIGALGKMVPWYLRELAVPAACSTVLSVVRIEGRPFHLAAHALLRYRAGPRRLAGMRRCAAVGGRWHPSEVVLLPDGSDSCLRRLRYTGPGAVLVSIEHERGGGITELGQLGTTRRWGRGAVTITESAAPRPASRGQVIALARGARLSVRPRSARGR